MDHLNDPFAAAAATNTAPPAVQSDEPPHKKQRVVGHDGEDVNAADGDDIGFAPVGAVSDHVMCPTDPGAALQTFAAVGVGL